MCNGCFKFDFFGGDVIMVVGIVFFELSSDLSLGLKESEFVEEEMRIFIDDEIC